MIYTEWPNNHFGTIQTYMASCGTSCTSPTFNVSIAPFFKIAEDGLRSDGTWASDEFLANNSTWTFKVPTDLKDGYYVVRHEMISLHAVEKYGAELYPQCFQIQIVGGTGTREPDGVRFPGAYAQKDPGLTYNRTTDAGTPYVSCVFQGLSPGIMLMWGRFFRGRRYIMPPADGAIVEEMLGTDLLRMFTEKLVMSHSCVATYLSTPNSPFIDKMDCL